MHKFSILDGKNSQIRANFGRKLESWTKFWIKLVILDG